MTDTGTPQVPQQIKFRDCPEEVEVWDFIRHIVTREDISPELWCQGMEKFRLYIVKILYPKITLVPIEKQEWYRNISSSLKRPGLTLNADEQAFFTVEEPPLKMWGLTRRGDWLLGEIDDSRNLSLRKCSCEEIFLRYKMHPAEMASRILEFVRREIMERRRRLSELESYFSSAETFAGIVAYKSNPFKGTGISI